MLPTDKQARKDIPLARGLLDYFPDALCAVAELSRIGNEQHNPGEKMHWAREKSTDEADALMRHLIDRGKIDTDGVRHATKVAWRALALLQRELEADDPVFSVRPGGVLRFDPSPAAARPSDVAVGSRTEQYVPCREDRERQANLDASIEDATGWTRVNRDAEATYNGTVARCRSSVDGAAWQCVLPKGHAGRHA